MGRPKKQSIVAGESTSCDAAETDRKASKIDIIKRRSKLQNDRVKETDTEGLKKYKKTLEDETKPKRRKSDDNNDKTETSEIKTKARTNTSKKINAWVEAVVGRRRCKAIYVGETQIDYRFEMEVLDEWYESADAQVFGIDKTVELYKVGDVEYKILERSLPEKKRKVVDWVLDRNMNNCQSSLDAFEKKIAEQNEKEKLDFESITEEYARKLETLQISNRKALNLYMFLNRNTSSERDPADYRSDSEVSVYDSSEDYSDEEETREKDRDAKEKKKNDNQCARTRTFRGNNRLGEEGIMCGVKRCKKYGFTAEEKEARKQEANEEQARRLLELDEDERFGDTDDEEVFLGRPSREYLRGRASEIYGERDEILRATGERRFSRHEAFMACYEEMWEEDFIHRARVEWETRKSKILKRRERRNKIDGVVEVADYAEISKDNNNNVILIE